MDGTPEARPQAPHPPPRAPHALRQPPGGSRRFVELPGLERRVAPTSRVAAVKGLEDGYQSEAAQATATLQLAESLFSELVVAPRQHDAAHPSALRVGVSCLLLEQICAVYSRYHSVLQPASEALMRSIFVPRTADNAELLGDALDQPLPLPHGAPAEAEALLRPYGRATYFAAYEALSGAVAKSAKANRSLEVQLARQPRVFDQTVRHWMTSLQRNFFQSWRNYTRRRRQIRAKYRAIFFRIRSDECKQKAIRRWRERAAGVKKAALADDTHATEVQSLQISIAHMHEQITVLTEHSQQLGAQIGEADKERQRLQREVAERQKAAQELDQRSAEIERLGDSLLDGVLMRRYPPAGDSAIDVLVAWAEGVVADVGGMVDGSDAPFAPLLEEERFTVDIPLSAVACVMLGFKERAPTRQQVVQLHVSPDTAPPQIIEWATKLVGHPPAVNVEQLRSGQRGILLLLLAGLFRFASQWLLCPQPAPAGANAVAPPPSEPMTGAASWPLRVEVQQRWVVAALAAQNAALIVAVRHPVSLSAEELDDEPNFLSLPFDRLADVFPVEKDGQRRHLSVMQAVRQAFHDLRSLYLAHAVPTLTYADLVRLLKDSNLIGGERRLSKQVVQEACRSVWGHFTDHTYAEGIGSTEITKVQFTEVVIRLALAEKQCLRRDHTPLTGRDVAALITERMAARTLRTDVDRFRQVVRHPQVQAVVAEFKIPLRRLFRRYATAEEGEGLTLSGFQQLCKESGWASRAATVDTCCDVFRRAQAESRNAEVLDLSEFIECACALAVFHHPNPFTPLAGKLVTFIEDTVVTTL